MKQISIILALLVGVAFGKSAEDYLHDASYKYIAGRHQEAALAVEEGLRENPGDPRLHLLDDLLKQMKDQQRQDQNQSGGGGSKDKQDKNKQDQKDQQNKDQQNKNGNGSKDQKDKQDPQKKQDQNSQPKDSSGQDKDKKQQPPQPKPGENKGDSLGKGGGEPPRMPGQMSKEEAERLLNSFVDDEKKAQQNRQGTPRKRNGDQDW